MVVFHIIILRRNFVLIVLNLHLLLLLLLLLWGYIGNIIIHWRVRLLMAMRLISIDLFFIIRMFFIFCHFHINKIIIYIGLINQNILFNLMRFLIFLIDY